ncbi:MAG: YraN family protein [Syntrophobacterales bacterium]|nr:YraN family protein [Syntrophobacterales bacterium]
MPNKKETGREGEDTAIALLKHRGYKIIERNYRSFLGEIDIIAEDGDCLVFVEVKNRNSSTFGESLFAIDKKKRQHMVRSATYYLKDHKCLDKKIRFDVVGIDSGQAKVVKHAFIVEEWNNN